MDLGSKAMETNQNEAEHGMRKRLTRQIQSKICTTDQNRHENFLNQLSRLPSRTINDLRGLYIRRNSGIFGHGWVQFWVQSAQSLRISGGAGATRTRYLAFRKRSLYPDELQPLTLIYHARLVRSVKLKR